MDMTFFSILAIHAPFSTIFPSMTKRPFQKKHLIQVLPLILNPLVQR